MGQCEGGWARPSPAHSGGLPGSPPSLTVSVHVLGHGGQLALGGVDAQQAHEPLQLARLHLPVAFLIKHLKDPLVFLYLLSREALRLQGHASPASQGAPVQGSLEVPGHVAQGTLQSPWFQKKAPAQSWLPDKVTQWGALGDEQDLPGSL